jgi:hypothetical protein
VTPAAVAAAIHRLSAHYAHVLAFVLLERPVALPMVLVFLIRAPEL